MIGTDGCPSTQRQYTATSIAWGDCAEIMLLAPGHI